MENKYDTSITLEDNSSLTYMLKNIEFGSTVLEFGPATGYMTKYLKEELQCRVYIVEIDRDAFEQSSAYAQDGICGSAEDKAWCEKFQNIRFDYITFADVLEHLVNPWQVLEWSVKLLKKATGKVLVSIPNIGHNAVLVDLLNNKFEYRRTGIMDNTHLRFFTHDSVVEMFQQCGLYIAHEDAVVFNLEYAGLGNSAADVSENVWGELQLREYGFVNQFLFTLDTKGDVTAVPVKKPVMSYECALYYASDSKYCEEQKILGNVQLSGDQFCAEFLFNTEADSRQIMIELFPFPGIINNVKIDSDVTMEHIQPINGKIDGNSYWCWGDSIKIQMDCLNKQRPEYVRVSGKLGMIQTRQLGKCIIDFEKEQMEQFVQKELEIQRLNQVIAEKDIFIHKVEATKWFRLFRKMIMRDK